MAFEKIPLWTTPADNTVVWRYMSHDKFSKLLSSNSLFFYEVLKYRQTKNGDKFEGAIPAYNASHLGPGYFMIDGKQISNPYQKNRSINFLGHLIAINCWGMDKREVPRKWNEYARGERSVVIKSKILNIKKALKEAPEKIFIGKINYINYDTYVYNNQDPVGYFMLKNAINYEWEHEVRLFTIATNGDRRTMKTMDLSTVDKFKKADIEHMQGIDHMLIHCDLNMLIDEVVVSPWSEAGYVDEIKDLLNKYQLHKEVKKSYYHGNISNAGVILDIK